MFANYNGAAEHQQQQQQRHMYVVYVSLCVRHAWFAMPAMFGASAAEVQWLLISSHNSGGPGMAHLHLRHYPIFYYRDFCALLSWEIAWGAKNLKSADSIRWKCWEHVELFTTIKVLSNTFGLPT
jgi:hypothetical protein